MTPRPDEYTLVCLDCDPTWPDSDLTREESTSPRSTAVHDFPTLPDREAWITDHQRVTGHTRFWRSRRVKTRTDRVLEMGVRYAQVCLDCHPEYAGTAMPQLDLAASTVVGVCDSDTDCVEAALAHYLHAGHARFRTEPVLAAQP